MSSAAVFIVFPLCLAFAAMSDLLTMTIPNRVPAVLLGTFFVVALDVRASIFGRSVCMSLPRRLSSRFVFFFLRLNVMGGGDAKLLTACAVWFGLTNALVAFLIYVSLFGGLLTVAILLLRTQETRILAAADSASAPPVYGHRRFPMGLRSRLGGFVAYPASPLIVANGIFSVSIEGLDHEPFVMC